MGSTPILTKIQSFAQAIFTLLFIKLGAKFNHSLLLGFASSSILGMPLSSYIVRNIKQLLST